MVSTSSRVGLQAPPTRRLLWFIQFVAMTSLSDRDCSVLSVDGFEAKLAEQLQLLQSVIVSEHRTHLALLQSHIDLLPENTAKDDGAVAQNTGYVASFQSGAETEPSSQHVGDTNGGESQRIAFDSGEEEGNQNDSDPDKLLTSDIESSSPSKPQLRRAKGHASLLYSTPSSTPLAQPTKNFGDSFHVPHEERNMLQHIVLSHHFELASGLLIMLNTVIIAFQQQYDGFDYGYDLMLPDVTLVTKPARDTWPGAENTFFVLSFAFNALFAVELVVRLMAHGWRSIKSGWMWFDTIVVSVGLVDIFAQDALAFNPGMMRVMRLFRLVRLLQVFEAMSSFDSLFLLLKALHASRQALLWSFLMLGLVQIMVGLFLCQILQDFLADESVERTARAEVFKLFGTFSRTVLTMFEITLANWVPSARVLVDNVNEAFILFFLAYRCMFCFAVLKVIAAVFITETNRVLESDDELTLMKYNRERTQLRARLVKAFERIDKKKTGNLEWHHLDELVEDKSLVSMMATLGFQMHDLHKLFWLLDDGDGKIHMHEFINKMGRIKGQSKQVDVLALLKLGSRIDENLMKLLPKQRKLNSLVEAEKEAAVEV